MCFEIFGDLSIINDFLGGQRKESKVSFESISISQLEMRFTCVSLGDWGFKFYEAFWKCAENQIGKPNCLNLAGTVFLLSLENQNSCLLVLQYKKKKQKQKKKKQNNHYGVRFGHTKQNNGFKERSL